MKVSIQELKQNVIDLKVELRSIEDANLRTMIRSKITALQSRIANRERYDALRSLGLVKTPYGWE
jgi:hypothetical protein